MSQRMMKRLERLPRVELHVHLEGSVTLPRLRRLWPGLRREPGLPGDPAEAYRHRSFPDFLRHFAMVTGALRKPSHLAQVTADLSRFLGRQRIVAAEVFLSPVIFTRRGIPFLEILDAVEEAARAGTRRGGPSIRWILDGVRQWGVRAFEETLECAGSSRGRVLGIGLGGDERSVPAREFAGLFAAARQSGFRTVAHAGEFAGPRSLRDAVEWLGAERIGHGIRALEDPGVTRLLKREGVPLDVCPSSNVGTGVVARWRDHPLPRLVRSGVRVSLNSDDPALFQTSLAEEYRRAHRRLGLSPSALYRIHRQSVRSSFLPEREKSRLLSESRRIWEGRSVGPEAQGRAGASGKKAMGRRSASGRA